MPGGLHPPLSVTASWPEPDYVNPETETGIVPLCACLGSITLVIVAARFSARAVVQHNLGLDDALIFASLFPTIGLIVGACLACARYDFGHHVWDVPLATLIPERKLSLANEYLYITSSCLIKLSILTFTRRLTKGTLPTSITIIVRLSIAFVLTYGLTFLVTASLYCRPFAAYWLQFSSAWLEAGNTYSCFNEGANVLAASVISVVQDFVATLLPMILFWRVAIPQGQKVALACIFALGFFTCAAGVVRTWYILRVFWGTYDTTWEMYNVWVWTTVEVLLATICASIPSFKIYATQLFRRMSILSSRSSSSQGSTNATLTLTNTNTNGEYGRSWPRKHSHPSSGAAGSDFAQSGWKIDDLEQQVTISTNSTKRSVGSKSGVAWSVREGYGGLGREGSYGYGSRQSSRDTRAFSADEDELAMAHFLHSETVSSLEDYQDEGRRPSANGGGARGDGGGGLESHVL